MEIECGHSYLRLGRSILDGRLSLIRRVRQFERTNATRLNDLLRSSNVPDLANTKQSKKRKITKYINAHLICFDAESEREKNTVRLLSINGAREPQLFVRHVWKINISRLAV